MTDVSTSVRRSNRRGQATRANMLEAALRSLASGEPGSVSANRIAKDIGATWGAVQYQFGDADGFWAAVLHRTAERRGDLFSAVGTRASLRDRVTAIVDTLYDGLAERDSRAIENLRAALPREHAELERLYPQTAAELHSWGQSWLQTCRNAFAGLDLDAERVREVATLIPGAMRGLVSERQLGSYADLDVARRGLTNALVAYLAATD
ncbi:TetR/AcrR family transcriptional regulator [Mycobacterium sp. Y57]|uniref:TetR/AcrR family transcriptional regulator n=1 Tax=Mycolicibacterium xanthum TaxID=2796469 RepID=UPI001C8641BC|nr:TetR/AcrR family transcriptional regulator [Mycolicibacterium xanthum]MBX7431552.1 TetR/AcrR family transcriptional regulator [Mycolicibacterium xanthum]